jgi:DNA-binding MarR family transcriptional regulator
MVAAVCGAPDSLRAATDATRAAAMHEGQGEDDAASDLAFESGTAPLRLEDFLPYQLNVVASVVSQSLSRIYAERYSIGVPEWRVLVTLGQYGTMTGKAVGTHSHMHKTKVSRAVATLEKRRLLQRRANREDLREAFLSLTPAGRAIYENLAPSALEFARRLAEAIDPADRKAFARALESLTRQSALLAKQIATGKNNK